MILQLHFSCSYLEAMAYGLKVKHWFLLSNTVVWNSISKYPALPQCLRSNDENADGAQYWGKRPRWCRAVPLGTNRPSPFSLEFTKGFQTAERRTTLVLWATLRRRDG